MPSASSKSDEQAINAGLRIRSVDGKTPRVATSNGIEDRQPGEESSSSDEDEHDPEDAGAKRRHERSVSDFSIRSEESETTGQVGDGAEGARAKVRSSSLGTANQLRLRHRLSSERISGVCTTARRCDRCRGSRAERKRGRRSFGILST